MIKLENDTRGIRLTPQFVEKSDKDIATILALDKYAKEAGNTLVLTGGYATEALCGGEITRAHGDVDAHIILTGSESTETLNRGIRDLLFKEDIKWVVRERNPKRVDYLEDDDQKEFFDKRRVEVHLISPSESNLKYSKKKLIDSKGRGIETGVIDLTQTVTEKIHKFYELKDGIDTSKDRHSSKSDYFDLKRLLALPELDREGIRNNAPEEYDYVVSLISKYENGR